MLLGLSYEACQQVTDVVEPSAASCDIFFVLPKTVDSDTPIAQLATQIRWWDWVRAELMEDQEKRRTKQVEQSFRVRDALWELEPEAGPKEQSQCRMHLRKCASCLCGVAEGATSTECTCCFCCASTLSIGELCTRKGRRRSQKT